MNNPWNTNAEARHEQLISGKDITFDQLLLPEMLELVSRIPAIRLSSILEVGCGSGVLARHLGKISGLVVGIDSAPACIKLAIEHNLEQENIEFLVLDALNAHELQKSFKVVVAHMVFHVVEDLDRCLASVASVQPENGALIFTVPHPCFWPIIRNGFDSQGYTYINSGYYEFPFTIATDKNPLDSKVPYVHRSLSEYTTILAEAGYSLKRLYEPFPNDQLSTRYSRKWQYPGFLIFHCEKR